MACLHNSGKTDAPAPTTPHHERPPCIGDDGEAQHSPIFLKKNKKVDSVLAAKNYSEIRFFRA